MYVCIPHTCLVPAETRTLYLLELELKVAVNCRVAAGNQTQGP